MNVGFPGGTYAHIFYVADVEARGRAMNGELNLGLDEAEFLAIFPLEGGERARLVGSVKPDAETRLDLTFNDVESRLLNRLGITVDRVNWFSTYRVHHRVAKQFRVGRAFLLGDAAHIHSPVGGQGMNTGIGDAVNLAWKLAAVLRTRGNFRLLESYEPERIAFARRLVETTDRAFEIANADGSLARFARTTLIPLLLPAFFTFRVARRLWFRTISQTNVNYRGSDLSDGFAGSVQAGDRLPWVRGEAGCDNFAGLRSLSWQAHVYGETRREIEETCSQAGLSLQRFPWSAAAGNAGIARGAFYLVRPDGYVGLANPHGGTRLGDYQARFGLIFSQAEPQPEHAAVECG